MGGKYAVNDNREIPDTCEVIWEFENGPLMIFCQYNANDAPSCPRNQEMEIRGTNGTMYLNSGRWEVVPQRVTAELVPARTPVDRPYEGAWSKSKKTVIEPMAKGDGLATTNWHARNFLDCLKSRKKCNCDIQIGHISTSNTILGHIALRTHTLLDWDAKTEKFTNSAKANQLLSYQYRSPYKLG